jgi:hypothetical protein
VAKRKTIDKDTLRELHLKSGNLCAFPECNHLMMNKDGTFIGQICHIEAAEDGGERFNENMTDDERAAFANLMLMCYEHHTITNDVDEFPVESLQQMKAEHEAKFTDPSRAMEEAYAMQIKGDVRATQHASHGGINVAGHGNVIFQGLLASEPDVYEDLEDVVGELLAELRKRLENTPTMRDIVVFEGGGTPNTQQPAFLFRGQDCPDISSWIDTLEERGLVKDHTKGSIRRVRMSHNFVKYLNATGKPKLSEHAARLLVNAAAGDATVMIILHSEGLSVQAGALQLCVSHGNPRAQAMWKAGCRELETLGFVESTGSEEMWDMTKEGWDSFEGMKPEEVERVKAITGD